MTLCQERELRVVQDKGALAAIGDFGNVQSYLDTPATAVIRLAYAPTTTSCSAFRAQWGSSEPSVGSRSNHSGLDHSPRSATRVDCVEASTRTIETSPWAGWSSLSSSMKTVTKRAVSSCEARPGTPVNKRLNGGLEDERFPLLCVSGTKGHRSPGLLTRPDHCHPWNCQRMRVGHTPCGSSGSIHFPAPRGVGRRASPSSLLPGAVSCAAGGGLEKI
jgi:hypothetical protein